MKTCIVFTLLLCMVNTIKANAVNGNAIEIPLTAIEGGRCVDISLNKFSICNNDINENGNPMPRIPSRGCVIGIDVSTVYLYGQFSDVRLEMCLDGCPLYSVNLTNSVEAIALPFVLSEGCYEILLSEGVNTYYTKFNISNNKMDDV